MLSIGLVALTLGAATLPAPTALADEPSKKELSEAELQRLRDLFNEAFQDEQAGRYEEALEKFKRIAQDRESASVRYRIAANLANLKRLREARDAYRAIAASRAEDAPEKERLIITDAAKRVPELDKRIPKLIVKVDKPPRDLRVTVDGAAVLEGRPVELDPGEHALQATSSTTKPFDGRVMLGEATETPYTLNLEAVGPGGPDAATPTPAQPERKNTLGYVALGGGGLLVITGVVLLIAREGAVSDIEDACPDDVCPASKRDDVMADRDRAKLYEPLGVGLAAVGVVAAGFGAYMLFLRPSAAASTPAKNTKKEGVQVGTRVVSGGAIVGVGGSF